MSTAALVSIGEYLSTSYRPDRDLVDGQLIERNVGEYDHSRLQGALTTWLTNRQRAWNIRVLPEQRLRVSATRFRIPDVCVISRNQGIEPVFTKPPLVCIEVLSKSLGAARKVRAPQLKLLFVHLHLAGDEILDGVRHVSRGCVQRQD
ncbi:MAG TPA: Uma2 family endonuclease [Bryobacteraceae bacterium]